MALKTRRCRCLSYVGTEGPETLCLQKHPVCVSTGAPNLWVFLLTITPAFGQGDAAPADNASNAVEERQVSWKEIVPNFLDDQKAIWTFPGKVFQGAHLFPTMAVL